MGRVGKASVQRRQSEARDEENGRASERIAVTPKHCAAIVLDERRQLPHAWITRRTHFRGCQADRLRLGLLSSCGFLLLGHRCSRRTPVGSLAHGSLLNDARRVTWLDRHPGR